MLFILIAKSLILLFVAFFDQFFSHQAVFHGQRKWMTAKFFQFPAFVRDICCHREKS
jgi:hypothetical protein